MIKHMKWLACLLLWHVGHSQTLENFTGLVNQGSIPAEVSVMPSKKYLEDKKQIDKRDTHAEKIAKDAFYKTSNVQLNYLLHSGLILFDNEVTKYVNKVADHAYVAHPELRSKLKIYVARSAAINAFTFDNGTIIVNIGLLANVENEAQLAFILCHELTHYKDQHVVEGYVENVKIDKKYKLSGYDGRDRMLLAKSKFSKEHEFAADAYGMEMYYKSDYDKKVPLNCFEILRDFKTPFKPLRTFTPQFFEGRQSVATDTIKPDSIYTFDFEKELDELYEDDDDHYTTHPNLDARMRELFALEEEMKTTSAVNKLFIEPQSEFIKVRNLARFEMCRSLIQEHEFGAAFYAAYNLLYEFPRNPFLQRCITYSLYGMARYNAHGEISECLDNVTATSIPLQPISHFFRNIADEELCAIAIAWAYDGKKNSTSEYYDFLLKDLIFDYVREYDKNGVILRQGTNKFEKFMTKDSAVIKRHSNKYLLEMMADEKIKTIYSDALNAMDEEERGLTKKQRAQRIKDKEFLQKHGFSLGIDTVAIVDPKYLRFNLLNKSNPLKLMESDLGLVDYYQSIKEASNAAKINAPIFSPYECEATDVEKFNTLVALKDFMRETNEEVDVTLTPFDFELLKSKCSKYGVTHVADMGVYSARYGKSALFYYSYCAYPLTMALFPLFAYNLVSDSYETYVYTKIYDLNTMKVQDFKTTMNVKDRVSVTQSLLYYSFIQMKRAPRAK